MTDLNSQSSFWLPDFSWRRSLRIVGWCGCVIILLGSWGAHAASSVLIADTGNDAVKAYQVEGTNWIYTGEFASGVYDGLTLKGPLGLAQDGNKIIYVAESTTTGRILRFDTNGVYIGAIGTNGMQFSGSIPQAMTFGPDGQLYVTMAFNTTASNCVYRYHLGDNSWSVFVPNSGTGYTFNNPRGLAFAADGNLYVADRQNNFIRVFNGNNGSFIRNLPASFPQGLSWDPVHSRLLATVSGSSDVYAYDLTGTATLLYKGAEYCLDVRMIQDRVAFTRYSSGRLDLVNTTNATLVAATALKNPGYILPAILAPRPPVDLPGCPPLPGTPIQYRAASTGTYLGSPAIVRLPNGDYLASHDYFGGGSSQNTLGQTLLYRSTDRGTNWSMLGQINTLVAGNADNDGCFWNHFFELNGALYSIGNANGASTGEMVIRRSTNNGSQWTYVDGTPDNTGRLFAGESWRPGHTFVVKHGYIWMEADANRTSSWGDNYIAAVFAATNANLLSPTNWHRSTAVERNTAWLNGTFRGWLEGNALEDRLGGIVLFVRVDNRYANGAGIGGKAAILRVNNQGDGGATTTFSGGDFDPTDSTGSGFVDFPGGTTRCTIRFDPVSERYWTLCNYIPRQFRNNAFNAERFRSVLVLASSPDLKDWTVERIVMADERLYSEDPAVVANAFDGNQTDYGFQYVDWVFDANDIIATVRTGFCDDYGGSDSGHNANYYLFRRVVDFRINAGPETLRITSFQSPDHNGVVKVMFATRPARLYRIEFSDDLKSWQDSGLSREGNGSEAAFNLTGQTMTSRFYRIVEGVSWTP